MINKIKLSIDAMGGDFGASASVEGASLALKKHPDLFFNFYGNQDVLEDLLDNLHDLKKSSVVIHAQSVVPPDIRPTAVVRGYEDSGMRMAINAAKSGETDGVVSSGNTGALVVMAKTFIGMLPNIDRPTISSLVPSTNGCFVLLDMGANVICDAEILLQFAIMGSAYAKVVLQKDHPSVALLNIGSEPAKGRPEIKKAAEILQNYNGNINFTGYVEPHDMMRGVADVVVADGFSGNIAIKAMEGTALFLKHTLKETAKNAGWQTKMGLALAKDFFNTVAKKMDHRELNGAALLGINSVIVKSHGHADPFAFSCAILSAYDIIKNRINKDISAEIERFVFE